MQTAQWSPFVKTPVRSYPIPLQIDRACPLTGSWQVKTLFEINDLQFFSDADGKNRVQHRVVFNLQSGLIYTTPCFTEEGFRFLFPKAGQSYHHEESTAKDQANWVLSHCPTFKSIYDIGCGEGSFLNMLPAETQKIGIDLDKTSIQQAQQKMPSADFICNDFMSFNTPYQVDVITMWDALEHLPDPFYALKHLRENAGKETRLILEVPILDRVAEVSTEDIVGFFSVMHLTHFSKTTLHCMLQNAGWKIIEETLVQGYNGYRVIAIPCKPSEMLPTAEQKYVDLAAAENYLQQWENNIQRVKERLAQIPENANVLIWGAGMHTQYLERLTPLFNAHHYYLITDSDPLKSGDYCHGIPILLPNDIPAEVWQKKDLYVVVSSYGGQNSICKALETKNIASGHIITLYNNTHSY